jgi:RNA polymerase-binding transcription factor DksA
MSQKGKAGKNLIQVTRDYIKTIQIYILSGELNFSLVSIFFRTIKSFFEKDKIIGNLKNKLEEKERKIELLQNNLQHHVEQLVEAQNKQKQAIDIAIDLYKKASERDLPDESLATLHQLCLSLYKQNKQTEPYLKASLWVMRKINEWTEEATKVVAEDSSTDINSQERCLFYDDICKYISWLQESMFYAKPLRKSLTELNNSRNIAQPHPYRKAFKHLKSLITTKDMPLEEVYALHQMINFIIENL